jgi:hypothetical protein
LLAFHNIIFLLYPFPLCFSISILS